MKYDLFELTIHTRACIFKIVGFHYNKSQWEELIIIIIIKKRDGSISVLATPLHKIEEGAIYIIFFFYNAI